MKGIAVLLTLTGLVTVGVSQTTTWNVLPDTFNIIGGSTTNSIKTLFAEDSKGMYFTPVFPVLNEVGNYEVELEVVGHSSGNAYALSFTLAEMTWVNAPVERRVELFNYSTNAWDTLLTTKSQGSTIAGRAYLAPSTTINVKSAFYVQPGTGEVRAKVYWVSNDVFQTIWVDRATWTLTERKGY